MKNYAGVWIDHRKAVIALISDAGESLTVVPSHVERQFGRADGVRIFTSFESLQFPLDDNGDRAFSHHLNVFYGSVIALIREADGVRLFGPGEAKLELSKQMEKVGLGKRIVDCETADKMTDAQIMAKVRRAFLELNLNPSEAVHAGEPA